MTPDIDEIIDRLDKCIVGGDYHCKSNLDDYKARAILTEFKQAVIYEALAKLNKQNGFSHVEGAWIDSNGEVTQ